MTERVETGVLYAAWGIMAAAFVVLLAIPVVSFLCKDKTECVTKSTPSICHEDQCSEGTTTTTCIRQLICRE